MRMEGKEGGSDVFTSCRGFLVRGVMVVESWARGTEEHFPDGERDDIDVGIFCVEGS